MGFIQNYIMWVKILDGLPFIAIVLSNFKFKEFPSELLQNNFCFEITHAAEKLLISRGSE